MGSTPISESPAGESALRRERDMFELTLRHVRDGVTIHDRHGALVYCNDAAAEMGGVASAEALVLVPSVTLHERFELRDEAGRPMSSDELPARRLLRGETCPPLLVRFVLKETGCERWSLITATPFHDAEGRVDKVISVHHEVTESRRIEAAWSFLAKATVTLFSSLDYENKFTQVAELCVPAIADWCIVDLVTNRDPWTTEHIVAHVDGQLRDVLSEARRRFPPHPDTPDGVMRVLRTGKSQLVRELSDADLQRQGMHPEYLALVLRLGLRSAITVPLDGPKERFGTLTLVSTRPWLRYDEQDLAVAEELGRRMGLALGNSRAYREAKEALASRDEFLAIAAHELKTPLSAAYLQLQAAILRLQRNPGVHDISPEEALQRAEAQLGKLGVLVDELVDVASIATGRLTLTLAPCDLAAVGRGVAKRFAAEAAQAGSPFELIAEEPLLGVWDKEHLEQVLHKLLAHALKRGRGAPVVLRLGRGAGVAVVEVQDGGAELSPFEQAHVFQRFERIDPVAVGRSYEALGVELWIVRQIVAAHRGDVAVRNAPDGGAVVRVELPLGA